MRHYARKRYSAAQLDAMAEGRASKRMERPEREPLPVRAPGLLLVEVNGQRFDLELMPHPRHCRQWIAKRLNMPKESVRTGLYRMMRASPTGTAYGLAWERVGGALNDGGAVVLSTPESKVKAKVKK